MSKITTKYVCQACGYNSPRWVGKCPNCSEWNTFVEERTHQVATRLSSLAAILYQVAWTRLLTVPFGGITYDFSAILAIYLLGLALGAAGAQRALKRTRAPVVLFGLLQAALAGSVAGGPKK